MATASPSGCAITGFLSHRTNWRAAFDSQPGRPECLMTRLSEMWVLAIQCAATSYDMKDAAFSNFQKSRVPDTFQLGVILPYSPFWRIAESVNYMHSIRTTIPTPPASAIPETRFNCAHLCPQIFVRFFEPFLPTFHPVQVALQVRLSNLGRRHLASSSGAGLEHLSFRFLKARRATSALQRRNGLYRAAPSGRDEQEALRSTPARRRAAWERRCAQRVSQ